MTSLQYQAPTNLVGSYNATTGTVGLSWTAAVDGIPQLWTSSGNYVTDFTADHVVVTAVGAGGGGGGAAGINTGARGENSVPGGGGGAYAQATFNVAGLLASVPIVVGAGGAGGSGFSTSANITGGPAPGSNGTASTFGAILSAGGGAGANTSGSAGGAGGTASVTGGSSVTTENGAAGGPSAGGAPDFQRNGVSSNLAGAGGAGGQASGTTSGAPFIAYIQNGGSSTNAIGGTGSAGQIDGGGTAPASLPGGNVLNGIAGAAGGGGGGLASTLDLNNVNATGSAGGRGGFPGGGGGGGGPALTRGVNPVSVQSGAGGNGGAGEVLTNTFWLHSGPPTYTIFRNGFPYATTTATSYTDPTPLLGSLAVYYVWAGSPGTQLSAPSGSVQPTTPPLPTAGFNGDVWGPNGGGVTPPNQPTPVLQALTYATLPANQLSPATQAQTTVASQMSDTALDGHTPVNMLP
jgi:hypothetical protein